MYCNVREIFEKLIQHLKTEKRSYKHTSYLMSFMIYNQFCVLIATRSPKLISLDFSNKYIFKKYKDKSEYTCKNPK